MKANELSCKDLIIGDWIKPKNVDVSFRVGLIGVDSVWTDTHEWDYDEIEPIPLTPEILEKNGFDTSDPEVKQYHFTEDGQSYHFSLRQMYNQKDNKPNGYSFYAFGVLTIIDYVHQLQHAFILCGIEKEIEL